MSLRKNVFPSQNSFVRFPKPFLYSLHVRLKSKVKFPYRLWMTIHAPPSVVWSQYTLKKPSCPPGLIQYTPSYWYPLWRRSRQSPAKKIVYWANKLKFPIKDQSVLLGSWTISVCQSVCLLLRINSKQRANLELQVHLVKDNKPSTCSNVTLLCVRTTEKKKNRKQIRRTNREMFKKELKYEEYLLGGSPPPPPPPQYMEETKVSID